MIGGFVLFHRRITEWGWYKKPYMLRLFTHLILMANHRPQQWQDIIVERGQLVTGRHVLASQTGISEQSIRTCLTRLEATGEITVKSTKQFSIITICKYDEYQTENFKANQQPTNDQPTINQRSTTNNNDNNENKENKTTKGKPAKGSFDPIGYRPEFIPETLWSALLDNRRFKKLQNSELALKVICKQFFLAMEEGYTIEDCIGTYTSSGWQTFKPEYMRPKSGTQGRGGPGNKPMSVKEKHALALLEVQ